MPGVCIDCVTHCTVDKDAVIACHEICQLLRSSPPLEQRLLHTVNKDTFRFSPINIRHQAPAVFPLWKTRTAGTEAYSKQN